MKDDLTYLLQKLGFPDYAIKLFEEILDLDKKDILMNPSTFSKIRTREAFNWLRENGVIFIEIHENGDQIISPVHPKIFVRSFYLKEAWRRLPFPERCQNLMEEDIRELREYKNVCDEIESILLNYWDRLKWNEGIEDGMSYISSEYLSTVLATSIFSAEKEILGMVIPFWTPNISLIWTSITEKIKNGVVYRRISEEYTWIAFGYQINKRDINHIGVKLRMLPSNFVQEKFFVIDNKVVLLYTPNISQNNFTLEGMKVTLPYVIDLQREKFEKMWENAIDAKILLDNMGNLKDKFLSKGLKIAPKARDFLEGLFDYGIFFDEIVPDKATIEKLKKYSVIITDSYSSTGVIPNLFDDIHSIIQSEMK